MNLTDEYKRQSKWRNWDSYVQALPVKPDDTIFDLGCSIGVVTKMLAKKASKVYGIDNNSELLDEATHTNSSDNIIYRLDDISSLKNKDLPLADGIWSSFVPAYFPDFSPVLGTWLEFLKPGGWIAVVEISDLFGHDPMSSFAHNTFREYYDRQLKTKIYDFEMGSRLKGLLTGSGLSIIHEENRSDRELSFNGPGDTDVLFSWECRFERMHMFKEYLGGDVFYRLKEEFLGCLANENHTSHTIVKFIVAERNKAQLHK